VEGDTVTRLYTKTGDDGTTHLPDGSSTRKDDPRIEAVGTLDELNAQLGVVRSLLKDSDSSQLIVKIQALLFELGADVVDLDSNVERLRETDVLSIESSIDETTRQCEPLRVFILPGGTTAAVQLHVARTICRRAERRLAQFSTVVPIGFRFLNRLSDLLFALARFDNHESNVRDTTWSPRS
jgi:cob(I)alamin adenosyltransferase